MSQATDQSLKRTPLCDAHQKLGARMVAFGGWLMPVQYASIVEEHLAVRQTVGLFDISHMGEVWVSGPKAEAWLNRLLTNDLRRVSAGQAQYTMFCNERGGVIDDLIAYRTAPDRFLLVINAGNTPRDIEWMKSHLNAGVEFDDASDRTGALALQGPRAAEVLDAVAAGASKSIGHFCVKPLAVGGMKLLAARTGYTGEDGFELICDGKDLPRLWETLLAAGKHFGIKPCGLGARDTLRLEMCYPLHGHELGDDITPLEAGLGIFVALDKERFFGKEVMTRQKQDGLPRRLIAFKMLGKAPPPRAQYAIWLGGEKIGEVTSGSLSPSLGIGVGMGFVKVGTAQIDSEIEIEVRDRRYKALVVKKPLFRRADAAPQQH